MFCLLINFKQIGRAKQLAQCSAAFFNLRHTYKTCWMRRHTTTGNARDNTKKYKQQNWSKKKGLQSENHRFLPL